MAATRLGSTCVIVSQRRGLYETLRRLDTGLDRVISAGIGSILLSMTQDSQLAAIHFAYQRIDSTTERKAVMRKLILTLVAVSAMALPIAAMADEGAPTTGSAASQLCKQEQTKMGAAAFNAAYGTNASKSNAYGKCVAKNSANAAAAVDNAAKSCRAERTADAAAFAKKYGTNGKPGGPSAGSNAFGKCVSQKATAATGAEAAKAPSAAKQCKALAKSDPAGYATSYGKDKNALGKCVSAKTHGK